MNALEIRDVTKQFGTVVAVNRLSLTVPEGSIYGFIGPNGSGKTTTIRMIMDILRPDSGDIRVFDGRSRASSGAAGCAHRDDLRLRRAGAVAARRAAPRA